MLNGKSSGKYGNRQRLQAIVCFFWWKEKKGIGMEWLKKIKCLQLIVCQLPVAKMGANTEYTIQCPMVIFLNPSRPVLYEYKSHRKCDYIEIHCFICCLVWFASCSIAFEFQMNLDF